MRSDTGYANGPARTLNQRTWNGLYPPKPHSINTEIGCVPPLERTFTRGWLRLRSFSVPISGVTAPAANPVCSWPRRADGTWSPARTDADGPRSGEAGLSLKGQFTQPARSRGTGYGTTSTFVVKLDSSTWTGTS